MNLLSEIRNRYHPLWRLRQLAWFRALQRKFDFPLRRNYRGVYFYGLFLRDFSTLAQPLAEDSRARGIIDQLLRSGRLTHFFDIGANLGLFSWHVFGSAPATEIYLFEPDPANIRLLKKSIRANGGQRVHLWEGAVAREPGPREFLVDDASGATGYLPEAGLAGGALQAAYRVQRRVTVNATNLDAYCDIFPSATAKVLLKIDVEGAEGEVIAGGAKFMEKFRPLILIECFQPSALHALTQWGYLTRPLDANGNYLMVPQEQDTAIETLLNSAAA